MHRGSNDFFAPPRPHAEVVMLVRVFHAYSRVLQGTLCIPRITHGSLVNSMFNIEQYYSRNLRWNRFDDVEPISMPRIIIRIRLK